MHENYPWNFRDSFSIMFEVYFTAKSVCWPVDIIMLAEIFIFTRSNADTKFILIDVLVYVQSNGFNINNVPFGWSIIERAGDVVFVNGEAVVAAGASVAILAVGLLLQK